jgi:hypothetical protein
MKYPYRIPVLKLVSFPDVSGSREIFASGYKKPSRNFKMQEGFFV